MTRVGKEPETAARQLRGQNAGLRWLKGAVLLKTRASNVELTLDRVTVETTDIAIRSGANLTLHFVDAKVRGTVRDGRAKERTCETVLCHGRLCAGRIDI